jgi:hypothetical protein
VVALARRSTAVTSGWNVRADQFAVAPNTDLVPPPKTPLIRFAYPSGPDSIEPRLARPSIRPEDRREDDRERSRQRNEASRQRH